MAGLLSLLLMPSVARSCPLCRTESGGRVRAGIFGGDFGWNLAATLTPAVVLVTLVALIHFGPPGRDDRTPRGPS